MATPMKAPRADNKTACITAAVAYIPIFMALIYGVGPWIFGLQLWPQVRTSWIALGAVAAGVAMLFLLLLALKQALMNHPRAIAWLWAPPGLLTLLGVGAIVATQPRVVTLSDMTVFLPIGVAPLWTVAWLLLATRRLRRPKRAEPQ